MSDAQKARLSNNAAWMGKKDLERKALKILRSTNCPLAWVYASTGAPSTETTISCGAYESFVKELHYRPDCQTLGEKRGCVLVKELKQAGKLDDALAIWRIQNHLDLFAPKAEGSIAHWEAIVEPEQPVQAQLFAEEG